MAAPRRPAGDESGARQARDVMAFGQEVGRVLSDGRVVGRAEPYAKVFPSSRAVKRAVGLTAWAILEDIALDARLDDRGRLVAETNILRIAGNLGLGKNAVNRHLTRLREHGFVFREESREDRSGRYEVFRYVLDPSACIERFTTTPTTGHRPSSPDTGPRPPVRHQPRSAPLPQNGDTVASSPFAGSREQGRNKDLVVDPQRQQQDLPAANGAAAGLVDRLTAAGVAPDVAAKLVDRYPAERIVDAVEASAAPSVRQPPAWIVQALRDNWDLAPVLTEVREARDRAERRTEAEAAQAAACEDAAEQRARADGWAAAVSAALDDGQLVEAVAQVAESVPGIGRRSVPLARAQLIAWAAAVHTRDPQQPLGDALAAALDANSAAPPSLPAGADLPAAPACPSGASDLTRRVAACLHARAGLDRDDRADPASERDAELEL